MKLITKTRKRALSLLLCGTMLFTLCPQIAVAGSGRCENTTATGLCGHHTAHDGTCGYSEAAPCTHEHTGDCYTARESCIHEHTAECYPEAETGDAAAAEPTACSHVCSEETGCIIKELNCQHTHDNACGYSGGTPCNYVCEVSSPGAEPEPEAEPEPASAPETETEAESEPSPAPETESESESEPDLELESESESEPASESELTPTPETESDQESKPEPAPASDSLAALQSRVDALPTAEKVAELTSEEQQAVYAELMEIADAFEALSDEEWDAMTGTDKLEALSAYFGEYGVNAAANTTTTVTIVGLSVKDKTYDGTVNATITGTPTLQGVAEGDDVTLDTTNASATFADKNAGTNKTVTFSGYALSGADAGKYELNQPANVTATINPKQITPVWDETYTYTKVYDGTTNADWKASLILPDGAAVNSEDELFLNTYNDVSNVAYRFNSADIDTATTISVSVYLTIFDEKLNRCLTTNYELVGYEGTVTGYGVAGDNTTFYTYTHSGSITYPTYTVTLNTDGGTINSGNVTGYTYGTGATLPTDVTKDGYSFAGWYENSDLSGTAVTEISATDSGNKTFYAKWTATPAMTLAEDSITGTGDTRTVTLTATVSGVSGGSVPTGSIEFKVTQDGLIGNQFYATATINSTGKATVTWDGAELDTIYTVTASYGGDTNYQSVTQSIKVNIAHTPQNIAIQDPGSLTWGDASFELTLSNPGSGTGAVTWESSDSSILSISGNTATIKAAGEVRITARKAADDIYNEAEAEIELEVMKAKAPATVPSSPMTVDFTTTHASEVTLPDGWAWQNADAELAVGENALTAVYTGTDAANYEMTSMTVTVTREACTHPENEHETRNAKDATCTADGYTGDTYCTQCGTLIKSGDTIAALGHSFTSYTSNGDATCTADGTKTARCDRCDMTDTVTDEGTALGHSWGEVTYTWADDGSSCTAMRICQNDETHVKTATATVTGEQTKAPTCTEMGETTYTATFAETWAQPQTKTVEDVPAIGHSYVHHDEAAATHTADGAAEHYTCENCSLLFDKDKNETTADKLVLAKTGHTFGSEWKSDETNHWHECSCGEKSGVTAHTETTVNAKDATCTADGYTGDTYCTQCGTIIKSGDTIAAPGHSFTSYTSNGDATCTADGTKTARCDRCDMTDTVTDEGTALGHSWGEVTYIWADDGSSCTATRVCQNDETHVETATATVTGEQTKAPTCTEMGETTYTATFAETWAQPQTKTVEDVPAIGHSYVHHDEAAATHTADGTAEHYTCENCSLLFDKDKNETTADKLVLAKTGHTFGSEWKSDETNHWHECSCGEKSDMTAHTETTVNAKSATASEKGYSGDRICSVCGYEIAKGDVIPVKAESTDTTSNSNPKTGDESNLALWIVLMVFSVATLIGVLFKQKRQTPV